MQLGGKDPQTPASCGEIILPETHACEKRSKKRAIEQSISMQKVLVNGWINHSSILQHSLDSRAGAFGARFSLYKNESHRASRWLIMRDHKGLRSALYEIGSYFRIAINPEKDSGSTCSYARS